MYPVRLLVGASSLARNFDGDGQVLDHRAVQALYARVSHFPRLVVTERETCVCVYVTYRSMKRE